MLNLKIGKQFPDSESVQRNLEIAQIPRLCGTYIFFMLPVIETDFEWKYKNEQEHGFLLWQKRKDRATVKISKHAKSTMCNKNRTLELNRGFVLYL